MHKLLKGTVGEKMLLLGNEAIVRGAIEAGVAFATSYPGTPSSEIGDNFFEIQRECDLYFEYSINEKVALELAAAASISGLRAMCSMKHVGLNVAADPLMTLAYLGVNNGLVIVTADDVGMFSGMNEQDNRFYGKFSSLPVLEPSSAQEAKDMAKYAFDLSEELHEPVILRTTSRISHSSGVVIFGAKRKRTTKGSFKKDPWRWVPLPAVSRKLHQRLLENFEKAKIKSNQSAYNAIYGKGRWGIVTNGASFNYVTDAIKDLNIVQKCRILKLGFSYPLPDELIKSFVSSCEKILIVEELEPFIEEGVKALAQEIGSPIPINGKGKGLFPRIFEFSPGMVRKKISCYFGIEYKEKIPVDISDIPDIPSRPPNLCPGCSHRSTYVAVRKIVGDAAIYCSDIGCYALGILPPFRMADFVICMGSSLGAGSGFSKVTGKKVISFIGDSTFFHSGIPGLINAIWNKHNLTLIILDNGTTAMTGFQPSPGTDTCKLGLDKAQVSIETVVKGIGVSHVVTVNPRNLKAAMKAIQGCLSCPGVSVIISRDRCVLYAQRLLGITRGVRFYINQEKCKNHHDCINVVACPALVMKEGRVQINAQACTGCGLCAQICPEHAILAQKMNAGIHRGQ